MILIDQHKTEGEWEIQLKMAINFISSKDSNENKILYILKVIIQKLRLRLLEIKAMKQMKLFKNFLNLFYKNIKNNQKKKWEEVNLFLITLIFSTTNFII